MRGTRNMTGISEGQAFPILPEGEYIFSIEEIVDKETFDNHDPMASIMLEVVSGQYKGCRVYDNIVIPERGSPARKIMGRTKHFLHCLGEPYEDEIVYDTARWLFKKVKAQTIQEVQKKGKNAGKLRAVVNQYLLLDEQLEAMPDL